MISERKSFKSDTAIFVAHDDYKKRDVAEAEKNLMRAVLNSAMEDIRKKGDVYQEARRYFHSKDDYYLFSFLSICHHLDLCPKTIRALIGLSPAGDRVVGPPILPEEEREAA